MAIETAIVTTLTPTVTGTASYEVAGFGTPQAAIVICSRTGTTFNPNARIGISTGFTDGTTSYVAGITEVDAVGTTSASRFSKAEIARLANNVGGLVLEGDFSAWSTDGLTINWSNVATLGYYITVILIKGCTNVKVDTKALSGAGVTDITTVGFKPNFLFLTTVGNTSIGDNIASIYAMGAAHNNSSDVVSQGCLGWGSVNGVAAQNSTLAVRDDSCIGQTYNGTQTWTGSAQDFDTSGFSINCNVDPGGDYVFYLAIDTGDTDGVDISVIDSPTATGTLSVEDPAFQPQLGMLLMGTGSTVNTVTTADPMAFGIGAFDETTETCMGVDVDAGASTTDVQSNYATKAVQIYEFGGSTHDIMHEATLTGFDSLGYNLDFPTYVDGTARKWLSIAINGAADTTAPILSSPTGTKTGSTTASGTVSTDEGNGTLYFIATTNATETAATIKAGSSQAVSATGTQNVSFTGLTASTTYYAHYVHDDAASNESNVVNSTSFTTDAASSFNIIWAIQQSSMIGAI